MKSIKIGIMGAGNMGGAFYRGLAQIFPKDALFIADNNIEKLKNLKTKNSFVDYEEMFPTIDLLILAIKPQSFYSLEKRELKILSNKTIISIMAGVSLKTLGQSTGSNKIVRSMPNLAVQIQKGVIGWIGSKGITMKDKTMAQKIFSALGTSIELSKEKDIDSITALSGSGPAYFFYLTEMLVHQAQAWGFNQKTAQSIAASTLQGAAKLLEANQSDAQTLRKAVTSKGGTTEAALKYLMEHHFNTIFSKALEKARQRSLELQK